MRLALILMPCLLIGQDGGLSGGRVEARGLGGVWAGSNTGALASYGVEGAVAVTDALAGTVTLMRDRIGSASGSVCTSTCVQIGESAQIRELLGGIRLSLPGRVIVPYGSFSLGAAKVSASGTASGNGQSVSVTASTSRFAYSPGGGVDFDISRHFGVGFDLRAVKATGMEWYLRLAGAVYFRFP